MLFARRRTDRVPSTRSPLLSIIAVAICTIDCGIPHDAAGTLQYVRDGALRVGVVAHAPWVVDDGTIVEASRQHWSTASPTQLAHALTGCGYPSSS
jgi:hypothetical protein